MLFVVIFALLGFFQAAIWPMTVAIMGKEYQHSVRGKIMGFWSVNSATGDMIGYFYSSTMLSYGQTWLTISLFSLGLFLAINIVSWFYLNHREPSEVKPRIPILSALRLPTVLNYCMCYSCIKMLHMAILISLPYYTEEVLMLDDRIEGVLMILYGVGGICGGVISGYLSDKVSDRSYVLLAMFSASIPMFFLLDGMLGTSNAFSFLIMFILGCLISGGSNLLSAVVAADMCDLETEVEAKSTLTGLVDASGGIGASIGQLLVKRI